MKKLMFGVVMMATALWLLAGQAHALGFRNPDQGAKSSAMGQTFVADADDPSAIWFNPAGLVQLKGTHLYNGAYALLSNTKTTFANGSQLDTVQYLAVLPQLYLASDFGLEKWRFGLGVNSPFGLKIDWGNTAPFRTFVTKSSLRLIDINPTVAYQITPKLSVGVGLDCYISDTELHSGLAPYAVFHGLDQFEFKGDGHGLGYNVGVLYRFNEKHSFGASYRSKVRIGYKGTETVTIPGVGTSAGPAQVDINMPQIAIVGYCFRPDQKWTFEVDVDWTGWEELRSLDLQSAVAPESIPLKWKSSWIYEAGAEYKLNETWALRGGYAYSTNTVPNSTFSPLLPDTNRHVFSAGVGFQRGRLTANFAYQYTLGMNRTVSGTSSHFGPFPPTSADGAYSPDSHAVALSVSWKF